MAEPRADMDIRRILLLGGVGFVILVAFLFILFRGCAAVRQPGYTVIYSNLDLKDASNVVARLKELKIPYQVKEKGRSIAVSKDRADEARMGLAEKNLPAGGVVGWEIFDEARLGATDFDRRIQLIRAISGELSRTIRRIDAVEDARVQIVIPETRLFAATVAPVTASVMLRLRPGAELSPGKVNGIVHLVASSVENLQTENVTVIDDTGKILTTKTVLMLPALPTIEVEVSPEAVTTALATLPALSAEEKVMLKVKAKRQMEKDLTGKAQEILNRFYPPNSVIIKVNIDVENTDLKEILESKSAKVKKISAIVLVDNRIELTSELEDSTFKAAAAAIGYNSQRGDRIVIQKVPFHLATPPPGVVKGEIEKAFPTDRRPLPAAWLKNIFWLIGAVFLIIAIVFVYRLIMSRRAELARMEIPRRERRATGAAEKVSSVDRIRSMTENNPERIADLLKSWLAEKE
jgi:flagellar M-ring protein FliF